MPVQATDPEMLWYWSIGSSGSNEIAYAVVEAADGGFMMAGSKSNPSKGLDFYVLKTDANGLVEWQKSYGGNADDCAYSLAPASDGGYLLSGYTRSFGAGGSDVMVLKIDGSGEQEWNATFGGSRDDIGQSVQQVAGGFIIAGGSKSFDPGGSYDAYVIAIDEAGNLLWNKTYGGNDYDYANCIIQTDDGGFIIAGGTGLFLSYVKDAMLIKTDSSGNAQWTKTYGESGPENAYSVMQTYEGGYLLCGATRSYAGNENAYAVKTDGEGNTEWQNYFGGVNDDRFNSMLQTAVDEYLLLGSTRSSGHGLSDAYLVIVGQGGSMETQVTFGGVNDDFGYDIIRVADGSCIIAGETRSYAHAPSQDAYIVKTNSFLDADPPEVSGTAPSAGSTTTDTTPALSAAFADASGIDASSISVYLDAVDITDGCTVGPDGFAYTDWGASSLSQGAHTVSVTLSDINGNAGNYSWSFSVDSLPPSISDFTPTNRSSISSTRPMISATFADPSGVNTNGIVARLNLMDITPSLQITATGVQYIPSEALGQGLQTVTLIVPDLSGNTATVSWIFRVDTVAPTISSVSPSNGATIQSFGDTRVTISASYSDNAEVAVGSIRLTLDGADITSSATITATSMTCARDLGPGSHTAIITIVDGAGNVSTSTVSFTINNLVPLLVIAAIAFIVLLLVVLLLSRRKRSKAGEAQEWEKPAPPPPAAMTYTAGQEYEGAPSNVEEKRYTPPLEAKKPSVPPPEQAPPAEKPLQETPAPPPPTPGVTIIEEAKPVQPEKPLQAPKTKLCPKCGFSNWEGATKCWYCDSQLK